MHQGSTHLHPTHLLSNGTWKLLAGEHVPVRDGKCLEDALEWETSVLFGHTADSRGTYSQTVTSARLVVLTARCSIFASQLLFLLLLLLLPLCLLHHRLLRLSYSFPPLCSSTSSSSPTCSSLCSSSSSSSLSYRLFLLLLFLLLYLLLCPLGHLHHQYPGLDFEGWITK